jgi:hypothetical protein
MTDDRRMRASDADRETAVAVLRDASAVGRLRPEEFYQRVNLAYTAMSWGQLDELTADLPVAWTCDNLPADPVPEPDLRAAGRSLLASLTWVALILLIASLPGQVLWQAYAASLLVPLGLLLSRAPRRAKTDRRDRARLPAPAGPPGPRRTGWRHQDAS